MFDSIGNRMKLYEQASRYILPARLPIICRLDGKAFHSLTRKYCIKPFDQKFSDAMDATALRLCKEIQGAKLAYIQSDEISILIHSYMTHDTKCWFDGQIQKITSISAAIATAQFSATFGHEGLFDSRVFVIPESDVCNNFLWRQQDATRNSINSLAQSFYSAKQLHGKNTSECQELIFQKGLNWNDQPTSIKRGRCSVKQTEVVDDVIRSKWAIDNEIPIFSQDRRYIERHLDIQNEFVTKESL